MLKRSLIIFAYLALFSSCQSEETITPREYPFIETVEVKSVDETGAIVEFEVLKEGKSPIESYGVEYLESSAFENVYLPKEYLVMEIEDAPTNNLISFKLKYDLKSGIRYYTKPFVKSNGLTVYGLPLLFDSKGVKGPEISEVSISEITGSTQFKIKGDYFSSDKELNFVHIPFLDEYFNIRVVEASNQELTVDLTRNSKPLSLIDSSFDLIVTVMDKSVTLPEHFTFGYPKIESVTKLAAQVGEEIILTIDKEYEYDLKLTIDDFPNGNYVEIPLVKIAPKTYRGTIRDYKAGKYKLSIVGLDFIDVFPDKFELEESWELITDFIQFIDWPDYQRIPAGNKLVFWRNDVSKNYSWDPLTQGLTELPPFPGANPERTSVWLYGNSKSELFVGFGYKLLGSGYGISPYVDLWRLDLNTFQWIRMEDIPLPSALLYRFFEYKDKMVAVSNLEKKYLILDPNLKTWQKTSFDVPELLKNFNKFWVHEDYLYYFQENTSYLVIRRFKLGEQPEVFGEFPSINAYGVSGLLVLDDKFYLKGYKGISSINLLTKAISSYQSIFYGFDILEVPGLYGVTEGKPYTLPITNSNYFFRVYQLRPED